MSGIDDPRAIARRLAALPERRMRAAKLGEIITALPAPDAAWLLDTLATAGRAGGPPFDVSLLAAVDLTCGDTLDYDTRREIYVVAEKHQLDACKELLFTGEADDASSVASAPRPLVPGTRPLTLGERKSLARSNDRTVLERLVVDPHADVVSLLLGNPHVTEADILRIATSRRSSATVLRLVLDARRFGTRPRVRRALLRNPNLPLATALRLVGLLNRAEQRELAHDPALPDALQAAARRRLAPTS
ncbi:MAG: hypothetical protein ACE37F_18580 [Nannocystaceae bacterium]|nr:hypothetical protein [bacterium]